MVLFKGTSPAPGKFLPVTTALTAKGQDRPCFGIGVATSGKEETKRKDRTSQTLRSSLYIKKKLTFNGEP